jgi:hypothetical protein
MPTIPSYQTGTIRNTDLPQVRMSANASADSFGGGAAQDLAQLGNSMNRAGNTALDIGVDAQKEANNAIVREQLNSARIDLNKFANEQYLANGKDAMGASQRIADYSKKLNETYTANLKNSAQGDLFTSAFSTYAGEHIMRGQGHEQREALQYQKQTLDQANSIDGDEIAQGMDDPKFVAERLRDIEGNAHKMYSGDGDINDKVEKIKSGVLLEAIDRKAINDPVGALQFLETHQDQIKPKQVLMARRALQSKVDDLRVSGAVMDISSRATNHEEAINEVMKLPLSPEEKEKAVKGVHTQMNIKDAAHQETERRTNEAGWNQFYQNPTLDSIRQLNVSETEKQKMTDKLNGMLTKKTNQEYANNYGSLLRLNNDELSKVNLEEHKFDISPTQYEHLKSEQTALRKGAKEKSPGLLKAISDETAEAAKLSPFSIDEKNDSDVVKSQKQDRLNQYVADFTERLQTGYSDDQRNTPKAREEVRKQLLKEQITKGWFWDSKSGKVEYQTPDERAKAAIPTTESIVKNNDLSDKEKSKDLIISDFRGGKLTREQAKQKLKEIKYYNE